MYWAITNHGQDYLRGYVEITALSAVIGRKYLYYNFSLKQTCQNGEWIFLLVQGNGNCVYIDKEFIIHIESSHL